MVFQSLSSMNGGQRMPHPLFVLPYVFYYPSPNLTKKIKAKLVAISIKQSANESKSALPFFFLF